jgi:hypothetical protein
MVKVKLVENKVNRNVGIVIVEKVTSQNRIPGTTLTRKSTLLKNIPNQVREVWPSGLAAAVSKPTIEATVEFILAGKPVGLCEAEESDSEMDMLQA